MSVTTSALKVFADTPASEEFRNAIIHAGSIRIACEWCGREHFGDGTGDWEDGEHHGLKLAAEREKGKYIEHDDEMVSWGIWDGNQTVPDCPCNVATILERRTLANYTIIMEYLKSRAEMMRLDAMRATADLEALGD